MAETEDDAPPPILLPCTICSRTFKPESLSKHRKACEKLSSKKRKIFDSSKQRIQGTELAEYLPVILHSKKPEKVVVKKDKPSWKEKHLEFVRAIRAARGLEDGSNAKTSAGTMFRPSNHERCPHCDRHFGPKAFDRHIEWCKEQKARIPKSPASNQAKERLEARTKYRAPPLAKSKRSLTREKYAPPSHHSSQDLCPPATRNQHQLPSVTAMPVIKGTKAQGGGNNTRASVSSPPLQRGTAQRASVRQRSASPTKRIIGSTTRSIPGKPTTLKAKQESIETKGTKLSTLCNVTKIRPSAPVTKATKLSSQLNRPGESMISQALMRSNKSEIESLLPVTQCGQSGQREFVRNACKNQKVCDQDAMAGENADEISPDIGRHNNVAASTPVSKICYKKRTVKINNISVNDQNVEMTVTPYSHSYSAVDAQTCEFIDSNLATELNKTFSFQCRSDQEVVEEQYVPENIQSPSELTKTKHVDCSRISVLQEQHPPLDEEKDDRFRNIGSLSCSSVSPSDEQFSCGSHELKSHCKSLSVDHRSQLHNEHSQSVMNISFSSSEKVTTDNSLSSSFEETVPECKVLNTQRDCRKEETVSPFYKQFSEKMLKYNLIRKDFPANELSDSVNSSRSVKIDFTAVGQYPQDVSYHCNDKNTKLSEELHLELSALRSPEDSLEEEYIVHKGEKVYSECNSISNQKMPVDLLRNEEGRDVGELSESICKSSFILEENSDPLSSVSACQFGEFNQEAVSTLLESEGNLRSERKNMVQCPLLFQERLLKSYCINSSGSPATHPERQHEVNNVINYENKSVKDSDHSKKQYSFVEEQNTVTDTHVNPEDRLALNKSCNTDPLNRQVFHPGNQRVLSKLPYPSKNEPDGDDETHAIGASFKQPCYLEHCSKLNNLSFGSKNYTVQSETLESGHTSIPYEIHGSSQNVVNNLLPSTKIDIERNKTPELQINSLDVLPFQHKGQYMMNNSSVNCRSDRAHDNTLELSDKQPHNLEGQLVINNSPYTSMNDPIPCRAEELSHIVISSKQSCNSSNHHSTGSLPCSPRNKHVYNKTYESHQAYTDKQSSCLESVHILSNSSYISRKDSCSHDIDDSCQRDTADNQPSYSKRQFVKSEPSSNHKHSPDLGETSKSQWTDVSNEHLQKLERQHIVDNLPYISKGIPAPYRIEEPRLLESSDKHIVNLETPSLMDNLPFCPSNDPLSNQVCKAHQADPSNGQVLHSVRQHIISNLSLSSRSEFCSDKNSESCQVKVPCNQEPCLERHYVVNDLVYITTNGLTQRENYDSDPCESLLKQLPHSESHQVTSSKIYASNDKPQNDTLERKPLESNFSVSSKNSAIAYTTYESCHIGIINKESSYPENTEVMNDKFEILDKQLHYSENHQMKIDVTCDSKQDSSTSTALSKHPVNFENLQIVSNMAFNCRNKLALRKRPSSCPVDSLSELQVCSEKQCVGNVSEFHFKNDHPQRTIKPCQFSVSSKPLSHSGRPNTVSKVSFNSIYELQGEQYKSCLNSISVKEDLSSKISYLINKRQLDNRKNKLHQISTSDKGTLHLERLHSGNMSVQDDSRSGFSHSENLQTGNIPIRMDVQESTTVTSSNIWCHHSEDHHTRNIPVKIDSLESSVINSSGKGHPDSDMLNTGRNCRNIDVQESDIISFPDTGSSHSENILIRNNPLSADVEDSGSVMSTDRKCYHSDRLQIGDILPHVDSHESDSSFPDRGHRCSENLYTGNIPVSVTIQQPFTVNSSDKRSHVQQSDNISSSDRGCTDSRRLHSLDIDSQHLGNNNLSNTESCYSDRLCSGNVLRKITFQKSGNLSSSDKVYSCSERLHPENFPMKIDLQECDISFSDTGCHSKRMHTANISQNVDLQESDNVSNSDKVHLHQENNIYSEESGRISSSDGHHYFSGRLHTENIFVHNDPHGAGDYGSLDRGQPHSLRPHTISIPVRIGLKELDNMNYADREDPHSERQHTEKLSLNTDSQELCNFSSSDRGQSYSEKFRKENNPCGSDNIHSSDGECHHSERQQLGKLLMKLSVQESSNICSSEKDHSHSEKLNTRKMLMRINSAESVNTSSVDRESCFSERLLVGNISVNFDSQESDIVISSEKIPCHSEKLLVENICMDLDSGNPNSSDTRYYLSERQEKRNNPMRIDFQELDNISNLNCSEKLHPELIPVCIDLQASGTSDGRCQHSERQQMGNTPVQNDVQKFNISSSNTGCPHSEVLQSDKYLLKISSQELDNSSFSERGYPNLGRLDTENIPKKIDIQESSNFSSGLIHSERLYTENISVQNDSKELENISSSDRGYSQPERQNIIPWKILQESDYSSTDRGCTHSEMQHTENIPKKIDLKKLGNISDKVYPHSKMKIDSQGQILRTDSKETSNKISVDKKHPHSGRLLSSRFSSVIDSQESRSLSSFDRRHSHSENLLMKTDSQELGNSKSSTKECPHSDRQPSGKLPPKVSLQEWSNIRSSEKDFPHSERLQIDIPEKVDSQESGSMSSSDKGHLSSERLQIDVGEKCDSQESGCFNPVDEVNSNVRRLHTGKIPMKICSQESDGTNSSDIVCPHSESQHTDTVPLEIDSQECSSINSPGIECLHSERLHTEKIPMKICSQESDGTNSLDIVCPLSESQQTGNVRIEIDSQESVSTKNSCMQNHLQESDNISPTDSGYLHSEKLPVENISVMAGSQESGGISTSVRCPHSERLCGRDIYMKNCLHVSGDISSSDISCPHSEELNTKNVSVQSDSLMSGSISYSDQAHSCSERLYPENSNKIGSQESGSFKSSDRGDPHSKKQHTIGYSMKDDSQNSDGISSSVSRSSRSRLCFDSGDQHIQNDFSDELTSFSDSQEIVNNAQIGCRRIFSPKEVHYNFDSVDNQLLQPETNDLTASGTRLLENVVPESFDEAFSCKQPPSSEIVCVDKYKINETVKLSRTVQLPCREREQEKLLTINSGNENHHCKHRILGKTVQRTSHLNIQRVHVKSKSFRHNFKKHVSHHSPVNKTGVHCHKFRKQKLLQRNYWKYHHKNYKMLSKYKHKNRSPLIQTERPMWKLLNVKRINLSPTEEREGIKEVKVVYFNNSVSSDMQDVDDCSGIQSLEGYNSDISDDISVMSDCFSGSFETESCARVQTSSGKNLKSEYFLGLEQVRNRNEEYSETCRSKSAGHLPEVPGYNIETRSRQKLLKNSEYLFKPNKKLWARTCLQEISFRNLRETDMVIDCSRLPSHNEIKDCCRNQMFEGRSMTVDSRYENVPSGEFQYKYVDETYCPKTADCNASERNKDNMHYMLSSKKRSGDQIKLNKNAVRKDSEQMKIGRNISVDKKIRNDCRFSRKNSDISEQVKEYHIPKLLNSRKNLQRRCTVYSEGNTVTCPNINSVSEQVVVCGKYESSNQHRRGLHLPSDSGDVKRVTLPKVNHKKMNRRRQISHQQKGERLTDLVELWVSKGNTMKNSSSGMDHYSHKGSLHQKLPNVKDMYKVHRLPPMREVPLKQMTSYFSGSEEPYDPYASAERQMMELLSHGDCKPDPKTPTRPTVHSAPASAGLETSSQSAFARYTQSEDLTSSLIENLQDLIISGHSASTLSLCDNNNFSGNIPDVLSSLGFNFVNNNPEERERTRKPSKIRAKMENASLSLQKSVCVLNYENDQTKLGVEIDDDFDHISDDQDNFSSPVLSKTVPSPFSSPDSKCTLPYSTCQMEEGDGVERKHSEYEEQCSGNSRRSAGSKFSADSAYSSLNRRSPHASAVHQPVEGAELSGLLDSERGRGRLLSSSSSESSLPPLCTVQVLKNEDKTPSLTPTPPPIMQTSPVESKLPRYCHECGSKYPVSVAKFCCQCGARRLVM